MVADIEGIANLYRISAFMNKDLIPKNLDLDKVEEFKILNEPSGAEMVSPDVYYKKALEIISKFGGDTNTSFQPSSFSPNGEKEIEKEKKIDFKKKEIPARVEESTTKNILPKFFDTTPKKKSQEIIPASDYEKQKFNKLIYGDKVEEDDTERLQMLESIDSLREELNRMDIKIGTIPQVDDTSTMFDIKNVYKMLLHKKNISVHYETAKDFILVGITQLVNYCDGRETSWGKRPNLTGWDKTARLKLNSLKSELSQLASNFFQAYDIGPLAQILLSLVPSAIMHASTRTNTSTINADNDSALQDLYSLNK
jgi:hypothetical protein